MQVNVEPDAVPLGDGKDAIQLALRVRVDLQRIDAAKPDPRRRAPPRRANRKPGATHRPALREGDDLHRHPIPVPLARVEQPFKLRNAAFKVDIDMPSQSRSPCGLTTIAAVAPSPAATDLLGSLTRLQLAKRVAQGGE